ncbi:capsular biosynthesis protein [Ideonella sp. TBM-1]|uniref:Capsular biosynthesis protein n=1 Tax=Ideonella livida TaxID=2707176 RepID=A0A7C9TKR3_9BURK|nr:capsular biosynthesis protein [Ideonella livida]
MIPTSLDQLLARSSTLLLQGPMGPFFWRLRNTLVDHGQQVHKVNFNAGDDHFYDGPGVTHFRDPASAWGDCLDELLQRHAVDAVVLFGQNRWMHETAIQRARARQVDVFVFEEGYVRPDYVTLELGGVNAESRIPRDPQFYRDWVPQVIPAPRPTRQQFSVVADISMTYAWAERHGRKAYPHYKHHRDLGPVSEGLRWVRGGYRKWKNHFAEAAMLPYLSAPDQHKRYFLVPLQVYNDSQIRCYSPYDHVAGFIEHVMDSFAAHAPQDKLLVLKHHPLDRPYNDYRQLIERLADQHGIAGRVHYLHDQHLPTLLQHAAGVVTVNSTTGLQSLYHRTPVITLGDSVYDVPGLVHTGELADFWQDPGTVDVDLFHRYRAYLVWETQLNASFYGETPGLPSYTETSRRWAASKGKPSAPAQAATWPSSTLPTLK